MKQDASTDLNVIVSSLEYSEGIERESWLVGDVTYTKTLEEKAEILKASDYEFGLEYFFLNVQIICRVI